MRKDEIRMKMRRLILTVLLGSAVLGGGVSIYRARPVQAEEPVALPTAAVVKAKRADLAQTLTLSAELKPFFEADIHAKVAGYLQSINVDIGDRVKKGDVIATLDIVELKDDIHRTKAAFEQASLDYHRLLDVIRAKPGLIAQAEVDKARAEYDIAKANLDHAQTLFDYTTIAAPFDGVVTQRFADPGAMIQASVSSSTQSMPLVHLAETSTLRLRFPVPEDSVPMVHVGTPCAVVVGATGQTIAATVTRQADRVDSATRTMMTEVDIDNANGRIVPGMYASATLTLQQKKNVLALPVQAVSQDDQPTVWVVDGAGAIEERPVQLGLRTEDRVEIAAGLKDGDQVIFGSRSAFAIGMKVSPKIMPDDRAGRSADKS
jgi:RND family efflux transporter MFP subunit